MAKVDYKPAGSNEWHEIEVAVLADGRADDISLHPLDEPEIEKRRNEAEKRLDESLSRLLEKRRDEAREKLEVELFQIEWDERMKRTRSSLEDMLAKIRSAGEQKERKPMTSDIVVESSVAQVPSERPLRPCEAFSDIMLDVFGEDLSKRRR